MPLAFCFPLERSKIKVADRLLDYGAYHDSPIFDYPVKNKYISEPQISLEFHVKFLLNWYYYHARELPQEREMVDYVVASLNRALSHLISAQSTTQQQNPVVVASLISLIYDSVHQGFWNHQLN
jgi:hypothetical protein